MNKHILSAMAIGLSVATPTLATAQETDILQDVGASERINYAGKLRMLTQRIAATACFDHAGISTDVSGPMLAEATAEFDQILDALLYGDEALGIIGEESDLRIIRDVEEAHAHWDPLHGDIEDILATGGTDEEVLHIATEAHETLEVAKHLVSLVVEDYADPTAIEQASAITLDIAGRQRMLAQMVSKDVCLISSGLEIEGVAAELATSVRIYQSSLNALRNGFPDAGIIEPPTEDIASALDEMIAEWGSVQTILTSVVDGGSITTADQETIFAQMNVLTGQMNAIVGQYAEASKLGL